MRAILCTAIQVACVLLSFLLVAAHFGVYSTQGAQLSRSFVIQTRSKAFSTWMVSQSSPHPNPPREQGGSDSSPWTGRSGGDNSHGSAGASPSSNTATGKALTTDDLRKDARLQKEVTLHLPNALLSKVLDEVAGQTGAVFTIDPNLQEEKTTLFVKEKPAWEVLSKLILLLGLRCEVQHSRYLLSPDPQMRKMEQEAVLWGQNLLRGEAERKLRTWASLARDDFAVCVQRVQRLEEQINKLEQQQPPGWQERRAFLAERLSVASDMATFHCYLAGWLYRNTPSSLWRQLWRGEILWFSSEEGASTLPADALRWWAYPNKPVPRALRFGIRYDEQGEELCFYTLVLPAGESEPPQAEVSTERLQLDEDAVLRNPLHQRWEQWKTPLEVLEKLPSLQRRPQPFPLANAHITAAELLGWIAEQSGVDVIADAYRYPVPFLMEGDTLAQWLRQSSLLLTGYLRVEENWLLYRHWGYWRRKLEELPERLVLQMEEKAEREGLSLDDYATLAAHLTSEGEKRMAISLCVLPFDYLPLQHAAPALRFWASLSADQKKAALQRQPLPYVSLTPAQQKLFREAMLAKLYEEPKMILFDALNSAELQPALAFVVERWREEAYTLSDERISITAESPEELEQQRHLVPDAHDRQQQAHMEQITVYFGIDSQRSVRYDLSICNKMASFSHSKQEKEKPFPKILSEK